MMVQLQRGNLLEADAEAIVNTVNTVGVMGKGIALQFKEAFPENFKKYVDACKAGRLIPGKLLITHEHTLKGDKTIINFPTKTEWFKKSNYSYIESGLQELAEVIKRERIGSIAIPPLGCGNGGLQWSRVKTLIEKYLGTLDAHITVYEPLTKAHHIGKADSEREVKLTAA